MTWTIVLESENKEPICILDNELYIKDINILLDLNMLKYLDPYGDTVFNHLQMNDLILDLQHLKKVINAPILDDVRVLAERCKTAPHTYLSFYGD